MTLYCSIFFFIANAQSICNVIGREACNIDRKIVFLVSMLYYLTKKTTFDFLERMEINYLKEIFTWFINY